MNAAAIDELICSQHLSRMFLKLDQLDNEAIPAYFTEDAVWQRQGKTLQGREQILEEMRARPAQLFVQHILHQLVCEDVQRDRIRASAYMSVYRRDGPVALPHPAQAPDMLVSWEVEFSRCGEAWRISHLASKHLYRN